MVWGAIASAGISAAGSLLGSSSASKASAKEARKNREWQERMSNTAHQREVADLRAAGLNPMLSVMHPGASTPSGSMAQSFDPDLGSSISRGYSAGSQASIQREQAKLVKEEVSTQKASQRELESRALANAASAGASSARAAYDLAQEAYTRGVTGMQPLVARELEQRIAQGSAQTALQLSQIPVSNASATLKRALGRAAEVEAAKSETTKGIYEVVAPVVQSGLHSAKEAASNWWSSTRDYFKRK